MTALSKTHVPSARMKAGTFFNGLIAANSGDLRSGYATTRRSIASSIPVFSERHSRMRTALLLCCMS